MRYPGFRLHRDTDQPWDPDDLHDYLLECYFPVDSLGHKWFRYRMSASDWEGLDADDISKQETAGADIAIICCQSEWYEMEQTALLVLVTGQTEGTLHCRWRSLVKVYPFQGDLSRRPGDPLSSALTLLGEALDADQLWTVD